MNTLSPTDHDLPPLQAAPPGLYRHYKGGWYEVIDTVRCSETLKGMTLYRALYGSFGLWVRAGLRRLCVGMLFHRVAAMAR
jgi:hypothetical protein